MNHKIKFILVKEIGVVEIVEDMSEEKIISIL
jgi:3-dehydroquinate synthetase